MKRIAMVAIQALVNASLLFPGYNLPAQAAPASTPVCGPLGNSTWSLAGSPYDVCGSTGVTVPAGVTLTIDPGVTVQFAGPASTQMTVQGALVAGGTVTQPITFTSLTHSNGS
jgi:hypothetical protein